MRYFLLTACSFAISLGLNSRITQARGDQPSNVMEILKAKDFWDQAGKKGGRSWTNAEQKQLRDIKTSHPDAVVRLRANKVLVDLAGKSRYDAPNEAVVREGFRYLEGRLKVAPVQKLCVEQGFNHYTVSAKHDGSLWLLIEYVELGGFNGGLNLSWDAQQKSIATMQAWGAVKVR